MDNTGIDLGTCFPQRPIVLFPPAFRLTSPILSAAQAHESLSSCPLFFSPTPQCQKPKSDGTDPSTGEFCSPKTSVLAGLAKPSRVSSVPRSHEEVRVEEELQQISVELEPKCDVEIVAPEEDDKE